MAPHARLPLTSDEFRYLNWLTRMDAIGYRFFSVFARPRARVSRILIAVEGVRVDAFAGACAILEDMLMSFRACARKVRVNLLQFFGMRSFCYRLKRLGSTEEELRRPMVRHDAKSTSRTRLFSVRRMVRFRRRESTSGFHDACPSGQPTIIRLGFTPHQEDGFSL